MNKLIVGNWKMYPTLSDSVVLAAALRKSLEDIKGVDIVLAPPLPWLLSLHEQWKHRPKNIHFAAQNIWPEDQGAFTGEASAYFLKDIIKYAIIGHSERRRNNGEDDELVAKKVHACLKWQITPVICVGETKQAVFADGTIDSSQWQKLSHQMMSVLEGISKEQLSKVVLTYEPVWAISAMGNSPATPEYTSKMVDRLRDRLAEKYGKEASREVRFLYGGSVNSTNTTDYLRYPTLQGALVGAASVKAKDFLGVCQQASQLRN